MTRKQAFKTTRGPESKGPYSTCVSAGDFLFVSGQVPVSPETGELVGDEIEAQTRRVLDNLKIVLEEFGSSPGKVVKTTIYLQDIGNFGRVNEIYGSYFDSEPPARACVEVAGLPLGAGIEIEAIALR